jgi:phosphatidate cytidylyltransferase
VLKTRVITAVIITLIGLGALFVLSPLAFAALAAIVLLGAGGWEAARLSGVDNNWLRIGFAVFLLAIAALSWIAHEPSQIIIFLLPGCLLWLGLLAWLSRPNLGRAESPAFVLIKLSVLAVVLLTAWLALSWLQAVSPWPVLMLMVIIAAADVGAYFTGRRIGGPKLAPSISPGKTRSGAFGGLVCAIVLTALIATIMPQSPFSPLVAGALAGGLAIVSMGGDLFISLLKRQRQMKDTSNLLPGHGGVLDRFDSLAAGLPFFALAVALWGQ